MINSNLAGCQDTWSKSGKGNAGAARPRLRQGTEHPGPTNAEVSWRRTSGSIRLQLGGKHVGSLPQTSTDTCRKLLSAGTEKARKNHGKEALGPLSRNFSGLSPDAKHPGWRLSVAGPARRFATVPPIFCRNQLIFYTQASSASAGSRGIITLVQVHEGRIGPRPGRSHCWSFSQLHVSPPNCCLAQIRSKTV